MGDTALKTDIEALLVTAGVSPVGAQIAPCAAGGNNRVYRVDVGGRALVAKRYFRQPSDTRDRLNAEYAFLTYAREAQIGSVPRPLAKDDRAGIALYEFIDGRRLSPQALLRGHIDQARDFFVRLNDPEKRVLGSGLPEASEACFSIVRQLDLVQERLARLSLIPATSGAGEQAIAFTTALGERWAALRGRVLSECTRRGIDPRAELPLEDRCISPSDFGFHNALVTHEGKAVFVDFEYAGWDDPAKAVSDFFSHPAVPVPFDYFEDFLNAALTFSSRPGMLAERTRLMLPVFQVKWCCIVMNDFLPALWQRRRFADPALDEASTKRTQLKKAYRLLELIHG
jgi:hypothetical protein